MCENVKFESDDLIYNRFDIIHEKQYESFIYSVNGRKYIIQVHDSCGVAEINLWGKELPDDIFIKLIADIFKNDQIYAVKATRIKNEYKCFLEETNDIRVPLPGGMDELMERVERRDRATIRRKLRWLDGRVGDLKIEVFARENIPDQVVETYFKWKKETHGIDYGLLPKEYLDKYYVTDAMLMRAGETDVAVAFFCQVKDIVFFENFSYNGQLKKYSPGLLMYVKFMEELIQRKCKYLYLGGGSYIYKRRFGAESSQAYSGTIYREEIIDILNGFFDMNDIGEVSFYGFGMVGHGFLKLSEELSVKVKYGIDKRADDMEETEISIYLPESDLPKADAVIITMDTSHHDVEDFLSKKFEKVYYWNDILEGAIGDYNRRVDGRT